ncbi:hypothetical protein AMTRI_Chr01g137180 [Amborella trichopoda]|uniref:Uncharacterized protein n=1 Tax=Amborella trichopoda TaxID=13333 RepID=W1PY51_AMBTC|nr:uncharacterized protein LOC110007802 [Amborella trichopoda]XP_020526758.1 uncharacterized protein LOC110007802 [Amborella trichopoda]XP_020526759.1 uncharacterized protein LOC110007802 [Amborella trichopoda]XP_020526760.1 uncharacterized protein LOC110007802 [Amborella trichopoda]XP_020526761.1 uncharacterized protein LOC110007802 [Amborella trichopoda]XP_020526762.1 uncharacterized protein LOC110007802 [Amborella trichopoda]ERN12410.1 hypothetical protein AMTR_s00025p00128680 [Amborella t|eukprot:XP_020526757.1 uncharacterized protein LOC110007802 [Amborella trichopoda]
MDREETTKKPKCICHRLYTFLTKNLAFQSLKGLTFGVRGPGQVTLNPTNKNHHPGSTKCSLDKATEPTNGFHGKDIHIQENEVSPLKTQVGPKDGSQGEKRNAGEGDMAIDKPSDKDEVVIYTQLPSKGESNMAQEQEKLVSKMREKKPALVQERGLEKVSAPQDQLIEKGGGQKALMPTPSQENTQPMAQDKGSMVPGGHESLLVEGRERKESITNGEKQDKGMEKVLTPQIQSQEKEKGRAATIATQKQGGDVKKGGEREMEVVERGKNIGEGRPAPLQGKDEAPKGPKRERSISRVISNIDAKSDAFIKRRKSTARTRSEIRDVAQMPPPIKPQSLE